MHLVHGGFSSIPSSCVTTSDATTGAPCTAHLITECNRTFLPLAPRCILARGGTCWSCFTAGLSLVCRKLEGLRALVERELGA